MYRPRSLAAPRSPARAGFMLGLCSAAHKNGMTNPNRLPGGTVGAVGGQYTFRDRSAADVELSSSSEAAFIDSFQEDPSRGIILRWRDDLDHPEQTWRGDPIRTLTDAQREQLRLTINAAERELITRGRVNLDEWAPGDNVDEDSQVVAELVGIVDEVVDLSQYAPGEDADRDALVAELLVAHRNLVDGFTAD